MALTPNKALTLMDLMTTRWTGSSLTQTAVSVGQMVGLDLVTSSVYPSAPGVYVETLPTSSYSLAGAGSATTKTVYVGLLPEITDRYRYFYLSNFNHTVRNTSTTTDLYIRFKVVKLVVAAGSSNISYGDEISVGTGIGQLITKSSSKNFRASNILIDLESWELISGNYTMVL